MNANCRIRISVILVAVMFCAAVWALADDQAIRQSVTLYASFDDDVAADLGGGSVNLSTRYDHPKEKGRYIVEPRFRRDIFRIADGGGIHGGALEVTDVIPRRGRVFFPAKNNIAFRDDGWGGSVQFWLNTDPNTLFKSSFCDPVQITHRGAHDGGLWIDFPNTRPRDMRLGAFHALAADEQPVQESDPAAPLITVKDIGFEQGDWHHVVMTWQNVDSGRPNAYLQLYIDGKLAGELKDRDIAMRWNIDQTGIYVAVSYIGLFDEFAVFDRPLNADEVARLRAEPGLLSALKEDRRIEDTQ